MSETSNFGYGRMQGRGLELTPQEVAALARAAACLDNLRDYLHDHSTPALDADARVWFTTLAETKRILGNFNNQLSFVACLMAKQYLERCLSMVPFDVALKPQGANGLDIDEWTRTDERVIGEIKTTTPRQDAKIEAEQMKSFHRDFAKLQRTPAAYKFMFVTHPWTYNALLKRYQPFLGRVTVVCLTTGDEYAVPALASDLSQNLG